MDVTVLETGIRARCDAADYRGAAELLVSGYGQEIFSYLVSRLRDETEASETFSTFLEDLWRGLPHFQWRCPARAWLYALARNAAARQQHHAFRRRKREVALADADELWSVAERVRTRTLTFLRTEIRAKVATLREALPEEERELLFLRVNRQLSWKEIAQIVYHEGDGQPGPALDEEAARLRKRFQLTKDKLRRMARERGLLDDPEDLA